MTLWNLWKDSPVCYTFVKAYYLKNVEAGIRDYILYRVIRNLTDPKSNQRQTQWYLYRASSKKNVKKKIYKKVVSKHYPK